MKIMRNYLFACLFFVISSTSCEELDEDVSIKDPPVGDESFPVTMRSNLYVGTTSLSEKDVINVSRIHFFAFFY